MAKVMISLLGGRPLPNVLAALHLKPDRYYIIVSEDALGERGNYEKAVGALPKHLKLTEPLVVKPYAVVETAQQCRSVINQHPEDQIIIVSASEPKTMSFGAYDVAKELRANKRNVDMCYVSREGLVWIFRKIDNVEPVSIRLKDYFASYGWNVTLKTQVDEKFREMVSLIVDRLPASHYLLHILRSRDRGKGKRTVRYNKRMDDDEFSVLKEIEKLQIVSNVQRTHTETRWTIPGDEESKFLLTGDWLEFYVYQIAVKLEKTQGTPLFDECGWGVKDKSNKGEIDFAGIFSGQVIIASCKTENSIKRAWFEELHSRMEQLGKGMCSALLVSSVSKESRTKADLEEYRRWAKERQIVFVMAEDLPQLPKILEKIVMGRGGAEPKHIPYYPRI